MFRPDMTHNVDWALKTNNQLTVLPAINSKLGTDLSQPLSHCQMSFFLLLFLAFFFLKPAKSVPAYKHIPKFRQACELACNVSKARARVSFGKQ